MSIHVVIVALLAHPVLFWATCSTALAAGLAVLAFHSCECEACGKPFGIFRVRDHSLELCYKCFKVDRPLPAQPTEGSGERRTDKPKRARSA